MNLIYVDIKAMIFSSTLTSEKNKLPIKHLKTILFQSQCISHHAQQLQAVTLAEVKIP